MATTKYQVRNPNDTSDRETHPTLEEAVLCAASHDGWGAAYQRDDDGVMRLYSSRRHIGNNPYILHEGDASYAGSSLDDNTDAINELASEIYAKGVLHSKYSYLGIAQLEYDDVGVLTRADSVPISKLVENFDDPEIDEAVVRAMYD
jgi:hypothetical protein